MLLVRLGFGVEVLVRLVVVIPTLSSSFVLFPLLVAVVSAAAGDVTLLEVAVTRAFLFLGPMMEKMKIFNFCFFNFLSLSREYYVEGVSAPLPCGSCALICAPGCGAGGLCLLSPLQRGDAQQGAEPEPHPGHNSATLYVARNEHSTVRTVRVNREQAQQRIREETDPQIDAPRCTSTYVLNPVSLCAYGSTPVFSKLCDRSDVSRSPHHSSPRPLCLNFCY